MLGEGVRAAFELLGTDHRTICYVEREAAAAAQLGTLMEAGALHSAPVWSDMLTFDGSAWSGLVDGVVAGFPCQDLSIAGRRAGLDGKRSGLFFRVLDIADDCGAWFLVLENVAGIATATATVVDEAEGEIEERAAARVLGELADRGWDAEWVTLSASDVGASHGRARWICLAWRVADAQCAERRPLHVSGTGGQEGHDTRGRQADSGPRSANAALGHTECARRTPPRCGPALNTGREPEQGCSALANPERISCKRRGEPGIMACANDCREGQGHEWKRCRPAADDCCGPVAHASESRLPHPEQPGEPGEPEAYGRGAVAELRGTPLFAPGPADPIWHDLINASRVGGWQRVVTDDQAGACPWAPATQPGVRMLADGMAIVVDESRTHQLRQVGNGVVPLQAAAAVVELVRRARSTSY